MNAEKIKTKNNFDSLRVALALVVFFYHAEGLSKVQELSYLGIIFSGGFAVKCFFVISGFLITLSFVKSRNIKIYVEKRIRRVLPAYLVVIVFCLFIGILTTTLSLYNFISNQQTINFLLFNSIFLDGFYATLPSALIGNYTQVINGSLWTIKIELFYYCCTPIILYIRKFYFKNILIFLYVISVVWTYFCHQYNIQNTFINFINPFISYFSYFLFGMAFSLNKQFLPKLPVLTFFYCLPFLGLIQIFPNLSPIFEPCIYGIAALYLSTSAINNLKLGRYGDLSYSIYLYHFPVIQFVIYLKIFSFSAYFGLFLSLISTLILSIISWNLIEKRFLYKSRQLVFDQRVLNNH